MDKSRDTLYLVVDTSIKGVSLGLVHRGETSSKVLWTGIADGQFASAGKISNLLSEGLRTSGCTLDDCTAIAVSVGPGSFTGIKIGLAWCYGLYAPRQQQLRWLPLSALDEAAYFRGRSLGASKHTETDTQCLFLASTRTHGYLASTRPSGQEGSSCLYQVGQTDSPWGALPEFLKTSTITLCGEWPLLVDYFEQHNLTWNQVSIRQLMELGLQGMIARLLTVDTSALSSKPPRPRYLRPSTAEENQRGKSRHEVSTS